jgi:uncharacterized membrane protein
MTRTITRSYDNYDTAAAVVENLEAAGISTTDISVVGHDGRTNDSNAAEGAGLGMLAIPGIGPVVAAGWLASTAAGAVAGAAAGGLVGSFTSAGVDEDEANYHAETVRRGGTVVSVKAPDAHVAKVEAIMDGATPIDRDTRTAEYRREGWTRFDERADPYLRGQAGI